MAKYLLIASRDPFELVVTTRPPLDTKILPGSRGDVGATCHQ